MLIIPPPKFRQRRGRVKGATSAPPGPLALTLVNASFDPVGLHIRLVFDRDVDITGLNPDQFLLVDGLSSSRYIGDSDGGGVEGAIFSLLMNKAGSASGEQTLLSVSAGNGIVAVDDSGVWAGVTELSLPFP